MISKKFDSNLERVKPRIVKLELDENIGIYAVMCKDAQSVYIGQSKNIPNRLRHHLYSLKKGDYRKTNKQWQVDFETFGEGNFSFFRIESCSKEELLTRETYWIKKYVEDGWFTYNLQAITVNLTLIQCSKEYGDVVKRIVKALEKGGIGVSDLERALHNTNF